VINLTEILEPVTFSREIEGKIGDLIIPEDFIRDFHFSTDKHLMIMIRIAGGDAIKVRDFFEESEGEIFSLKTVGVDGKKISDDFVLADMYMDEGPPVGVDINQEQAMVRLILDFKLK
jgi:hypothetical protein